VAVAARADPLIDPLREVGFGGGVIAASATSQKQGKECKKCVFHCSNNFLFVTFNFFLVSKKKQKLTEV
jgi:hypothetical protein